MGEETTWEKVIELIPNCSIDKLDATLTPTDNNPLKDTSAESNHTDSPPKPTTILQKRQRPNTSQLARPSKRIKINLASSQKKKKKFTPTQKKKKKKKKK